MRLTFVIILAIMIFSPSVSSAEIMARGQVVEVISQELTGDDLMGWAGEQLLRVRVLSGELKGDVLETVNYLTGHPRYDLIFSAGDRVMLVVEPGPAIYVQDYYRGRPLIWTTVLFVVLLVLVGRIKGLRALAALVVSGLLIWKGFLPHLMAGRGPLLGVAIYGSLITLLSILILVGPNRKGWAAAFGTSGGVAVAGALAFLIGRWAGLTGMQSEEAQMFYFFSDRSLDLSGVLFASMTIGALGAIMDVGVSVASAIEEVGRANPQASPLSLFRSGIRVGQDIVGTMANTLILAYVGGALPLILLFFMTQPNLAKIINAEIVAGELIRALVGSIGLVLAVPITALLASGMISHLTQKK